MDAFDATFLFLTMLLKFLKGLVHSSVPLGLKFPIQGNLAHAGAKVGTELVETTFRFPRNTNNQHDNLPSQNCINLGWKASKEELWDFGITGTSD